MNKLTRMRAYGVLALLFLALSIAGCGDDEPQQSAAIPAINGITPAQVSLGQRNVEGSIQGQNLSGVMSVDLGASILVQSFQAVSASEIQVVFTVGRDAQPGPRTITVSTSAGTGSSAAIFTVSNNQVPVPSFTISPRTGSKNAEITFDASASTDQGGTIAKYAWDFGDGKSAAGQIVTHKYPIPGDYEVMLTLTDNQQGTNYVVRSLEIENNVAPVARFSVSPGTTGDTNTQFTFDGSDSEDSDGRILRYSWAFGDGQRSEGKVVNHVFGDDKIFTVGLTVTDNDDARDLKEKDVTVERGDSGGRGCNSAMEDVDEASCGGFEGQQFCVVSVQGNVMVTSTTIRRCPGLCGEVRRREDGIREFVGDIDRIDGTRVTLDYGSLPGTTRPKAGERLRAIWRPCH